MPPLIVKFIRYIVTGGLAAVVDAGGFQLLVMFGASTAPAAITSWLAAAAALPVPEHCKYIVATMSVDKLGQCAVVYAALMFTHPELQIIDFDSEPLHGSLFARVGTRIRELSDACRSRGSIVFVPEILYQHARAGGLACELTPEDLEPEELLLSASNHSSSGQVKLCTPAFEKSRLAPFQGALDFRASEDADDP